jgi:hypothetical protein
LNSILPNMRLVSLPSQGLGEDWYEIITQIDELTPTWGMDLAEESVFLLFNRSPGSVLHGEGQCQIARSLIGPLVKLEPPFELTDWISSPVYRNSVAASLWPEVLQEAFAQWQELQRQGKKVRTGFILCLKRGLKPELRLELDAIFNE